MFSRLADKVLEDSSGRRESLTAFESAAPGQFAGEWPVMRETPFGAESVSSKALSAVGVDKNGLVNSDTGAGVKSRAADHQSSVRFIRESGSLVGKSEDGDSNSAGTRVPVGDWKTQSQGKANVTANMDPVPEPPEEAFALISSADGSKRKLNAVRGVAAARDARMDARLTLIPKNAAFDGGPSEETVRTKPPATRFSMMYAQNVLIWNSKFHRWSYPIGSRLGVINGGESESQSQIPRLYRRARVFRARRGRDPGMARLPSPGGGYVCTLEVSIG